MSHVCRTSVLLLLQYHAGSAWRDAGADVRRGVRDAGADVRRGVAEEGGGGGGEGGRAAVGRLGVWPEAGRPASPA